MNVGSALCVLYCISAAAVLVDDLVCNRSASMVLCACTIEVY